MIRAVVDTNILIRSFIKPQGTARPVLGLLRDRRYVLLYSTELVDVLERPRLRVKYRIENEDVEALLRLLLLRGEAVTPGRRIEVCRDPDDDKVLEVAVSGRADVIVTGDDDLLVLHPFEGVGIVGASAFLARLGP
jgi:uncharacterized protein